MAEPTDDPAGLGASADDWTAGADGLDDENWDDGDSSLEEEVLSQDEIDSLLDMKGGLAGVGRKTGIRSIINSALVSYGRLPMLERVFDNLVRLMSTSLRNFTSDNVDVSVDSITYIRFGEYLNSIPQPAIHAIFRAEEWDNYGLLVADSNLVYSIVDVLLGGRKGTHAMRIEGRPYTTIERNLVERMIVVVLKDMRAAFEPLTPVNFSFDRLEVSPRFATIARETNAAILVKLRIDMDDRGGRLELLLPYATLEPVRELLLQMFMGEKFGQDTIWENHLANELWSTELQVDAVLDELTMPLRDVMDLQVGQTVMLNYGPDSPVEIRCGGIPMLRGRMGRLGDNIAVRVEQRIGKPKVRA
jgi:flagellar motor switch protein FliM